MWREFVEQAEKRDEPFAALCARFRISRKTGYKWLNRFRAAGPAGLVALSRRPKSSPRRTPDEVIAMLVALRREQPELSAVRLQAGLREQGVAPLPAPSTIDLILRRHREAVETRAPQSGAALADVPNHRWSCECGAVIRTVDGVERVPWLVRDEASDFLLGARLLPPGREPDWTEWLTGIFRRQGLPWRLRLPGDPALRDEAPCRWHESHTVRLMRLGIFVEFDFDGGQGEQPAAAARQELAARLAALPPYQRAPLAERLMAADRLQDFRLAAAKSTADELDARLEAWIAQHNFGGRQEAMQRRGPVAVYRPSERLLPAEPAGPRYSAQAELRVVSEKGIFTFRRRLVHVGRVFATLEVELKPAVSPAAYEVEFGGQPLGRVDLAAAAVDETTSLPLMAG
jgi:putative transposase